MMIAVNMLMLFLKTNFIDENFCLGIVRINLENLLRKILRK
jgi:hypothetical protein